MSKLPGGELAFRPLHFYWMCDCSGSMSVDGKIDTLNDAISSALPEMRQVASENPNARIFVQAMRFSHEAKWVTPEPISLDKYAWTNLKADELQKPAVDIVFLLDTSGSMGDEIESVKKSCINFADEIIRQGANVRLGLIGFDIGGHRGTADKYSVHNLSHYTIGIWKLTNPADFKKNIASLTLCLFGGGGCYLANPDTVDIFPHVVQTFDGPKENTRILVIISDEMGSTAGVNSIVEELKKGAIRAYVLGVSSPSGAHQQIAQKTEGEFWDIMASKGVNDFSTLLGKVAGAIAKEVTKTLADGSLATGTDMGKALKIASARLKIPPMPERALPPVVVLVSDGQPTDDFDAGLQAFMAQPWGKKAVRIAIGIGRDADINCLQKFIGHNELKPLHAGNPEQLVKYIKWASTEIVKAASAPPSVAKTSPSTGLSVPLPDIKPTDDIVSSSGDVW